MRIEGGCYCKEVRYEYEGEPLMRAQCHCRECQYITGGSPNVFLGVAPAGFRFTRGAPKPFTRTDIDNPYTREFCPNCGTHLVTRSASRPGLLVIKVGTMDDPSAYGGPQVAIWLADKQPWHRVPEGVPCFEQFPPPPPKR